MRRPAGPKKCRSPPHFSPPPRCRRRIPDARLPSHPSISDRGVPRALRVSTLPKMTSNPPDELDELIGFLADKRADARAQAAEIVQGLTGSDDGTAQLVRKAETLVPKLLHLMGAPTSESKPSTTALVNLTASPDVATRAVEKGAVERAMEFLRAGAESDGCPPDLLLSLLANVTNTEGGVHVFSQDGKPLEGFFVTKLVQMLAASEPKDAYDHAASVLTNVARHPAGRRALLDPKRGLIFAALPSMSPPASETRRCGVAAALRNCCVDEQSCASLLAARGGAPAAAGDDDPSSPGASPAATQARTFLVRATAERPAPCTCTRR